MQPIIMVTGIPGVGKTTISKNPLVGDIGVLVQTFGELMLFKGKELGLVQTGAELAKIPLHIRQKLQMMAAERILNDAKSMPVVIDGHLLVDTPTGFVPGLPYECVTSLGLSAIIILTAPASDILSRRENNKAKYQLMNGRSGIDRIAFHEELLVKASLQYAILSGDKIEDTVKSLIMLLGKLIPDLLQ